jgi:dTMP kinase
MKSLFIVFEGIDGSGTSTQAILLKDYFIHNNHKAIVTSEPSDGPVGHLIKEGLKGRAFFTTDKSRFDEQMAYLFAADRHDHLYNEVDGVFKLIDGGFHVISTRYYFSSLTYHCNTQQDLDFVSKLNERFPKPDLVIYIDNSVDVSLMRIGNRPVADMYENQEKLIKVKSNYDSIFSHYDGLILRVNGAQDINIIHKAVVGFIEENIYG